MHKRLEGLLTRTHTCIQESEPAALLLISFRMKLAVRRQRSYYLLPSPDAMMKDKRVLGRRAVCVTQLEAEAKPLNTTSVSSGISSNSQFQCRSDDEDSQGE